MKTALAVLFVALAVMSSTPLRAQIAVDTASLNRGIRPYDVPIDPDRYLIRPGEQLRIIFLNTKLPDLWLTVDSEGRIVHRELGTFELAGLTLAQARTALIGPLSRLFNAESIRITIGAIYPVSIMVYGFVRSPGRYLGFTSQTVDEIVDSAGGLRADGSKRRIKFLGGPDQIEVDLQRALVAGESSANAYLYSGNKVYVPPLSDSIVQIVGEIKSPGAFEFRATDDLTQLISLAGGYTPLADSSGVYLANDKGRDPMGAGNLRTGDIVMVPKRAESSIEKMISVFGAVANPGRYSYHEDLALRKLIVDAGGVLPEANSSRVAVFRKLEPEPGKPTPLGRYPLMSDITSTDFELNLLPGDSVYVPVSVGFVQVLGDVLRPGYFPFRRGESVEYYLKLAGGEAGQGNELTTSIVDRVSGMTRISKLKNEVHDGDRIIIQLEEPGQ